MTGKNARSQNLRDMSPSMGSAKNVKDTKQLSGEATKDSLTGKNVMKEFKTSAPPKGKMGGLNTSS